MFCYLMDNRSSEFSDEVHVTGVKITINDFHASGRETGARYARVKTYVFPSRLFFNEFSIFYVHKLSLWRNATNVKRD